MFYFKDLIDLAIGSPESGHVNFYALHVLLSNMAHRLGMLDDVVDYDDILMGNMKAQSSLIGRSSKYRLYAGADAEGEEAVAAEVPEEAAAEVVEAPPQDAPNDMAPQSEAGEMSEPPPGAEVDAQSAGFKTPPPTEIASGNDGVVGTPAAAETAAGTAIATTAGTPAGTAPGTAAGTAAGTVEGTAASSRAEIPRRSFEEQRSVLAVRPQMSRIEAQRAQEVADSVTVMGNQLMLAIEQLNNVTHLLLDRKPDPERVKQLREMAIELRTILRPDVEFTSWISVENIIEEAEAEEEEDLELLPSSGSKELAKIEEEEEESLELDQHLCYTMERMLNELLELKSDFCALTNKVNELAAALLKQDCQRIVTMMQELQDQVRELKVNGNAAREAFEALVVKVNTAVADIQDVKKDLANLDEVKIDKTEVEILLAEKVDFAQLQTKVSIEQMEEFKLKLEKQFCEVRSIMSANEKNVLYIIDNLRTTLGLDALELSLKDFRDQIEKRVQMLAEALENFMNMTNDDCAAAAGRVKVLQDLACLSCDTPCVMRSVEKAKVGKLPSAKASTTMGALVTYELGSIRKSGIMGYYRKDEFPHAADAWLKKAPMNKCVPRHAGGEHTVHTADDHIQKVILSKRNTPFK